MVKRCDNSNSHGIRWHARVKSNNLSFLQFFLFFQKKVEWFSCLTHTIHVNPSILYHDVFDGHLVAPLAVIQLNACVYYSPLKPL